MDPLMSPSFNTCSDAHLVTDIGPFHIDVEMASLLSDMSEEDLRSFAETQEDPISDEQIELYIFSCFFIFQKTCSVEYLERATQRAEGWFAIAAKDHPDRARRLQLLDMMSARVSQLSALTGDALPTNSQVNIMLEAFATQATRSGTSRDSPDDDLDDDLDGHLVALNEQANNLVNICEETGDVEQMNEAVKTMELAAEMVTGGHPRLPLILLTLGVVLHTRFQRTASIDDLNRAIEVTNIAVEAMSQDDPKRPFALTNLGTCLTMRQRHTGSMDNLDRAIEVTNIAVEAMSQDDPERPFALSNLGASLKARAEWTGSRDDLSRAIEAITIAVDALPQDHPRRAFIFNNLSHSHAQRFERTGLMGDINHAVEAASIAVDATPQNYPIRAMRLGDLANCLRMRSDKTGSIDDINRAVKATTMAVDATPQDHPEWAGRMNNLSNVFGTRFEQTGSGDDLDHAIKAANMAVDATPQNSAGRALMTQNLGHWLNTRFEQTGSMDDLNRAISTFRDGWCCRNASPSQRILLAQRAAELLASQSNWEETSVLLEDAARLLPTVSPRSWEHIEKQHMLARFAGLASTAAATALKAEKAVEHALQLLELGRGVIAGLLMEARADISDLRGQHPGLADEFVRLRDELDSPDSKPAYLISADTTDTPSWKPEAERRRKADQNFDRLVENIRTQPGFSNFLLPPTAAELMAAADPDPIIVVNLSPYGCDSFLIERHRVRAVELPDLTLEEVDRQVRDLRSPCRDTSSLLKWLWDVVCGPSLEALGFTTPPTPGHDWPRVWWIPTGLLSQMPLHAAGYHAHGSADTVIDRVMSSYASSVKALRYARRHHIRKSAGPLSDLALLVAMRETPGLGINGNLPFATNEVGVLSSFCTSLRLQAITPKLRKDDVLKHLQACQIFHFAGHGRSDPTEPSHSCLLLEDWESTPLTVEDLRNHKLHENPPFLAYLSACSTGANQVDMLADEGIHLVSAFQLAGFRHVIGTLWEVSDEHCVDVAKVVYETMRDEGITDVAVCRGLHRAARALRDGQIEIESAGRDAKLLGFGSQARRTTNLYWVPYVHFGV